MTLIDRIKNVTELWGLLLPDVEPPSSVWMGRWCDFPDSAIEQGIVRACKVFSPERTKGIPPEAERVWRYVTGVLRNEARSSKQANRFATRPQQHTATVIMDRAQ